MDGSTAGGGRSNIDSRQEEDGGIQDLHRRRRIPHNMTSNMAERLADTHDKPGIRIRTINRVESTSSELRDALAGASPNPVAFSSVNQENYAQGTSRGSGEVGFNSELKMARERVLAGLRKVDSGEISSAEMQDMLFEMVTIFYLLTYKICIF